MPVARSRWLVADVLSYRPQAVSYRPDINRVVDQMRGEGQYAMKVRASVKKICVKCKVINRRGVVRVICENAKHKQRQG